MDSGALAMLVDLHAHYPMHLVPGPQQRTHERVPRLDAPALAGAGRRTHLEVRELSGPG